MSKFNFNPNFDAIVEYLPSRAQGRPAQKWDDYIHEFLWTRFPTHLGHHWFDIILANDVRDCEDEYVVFLGDKLA